MKLLLCVLAGMVALQPVCSAPIHRPHIMQQTRIAKHHGLTEQEQQADTARMFWEPPLVQILQGKLEALEQLAKAESFHT